jgi:hypothetical protein
MKATRLLLPLATLAGATLLLAPAQGFSLLGTNLSLAQRDFRVHNNFTGTAANDNVTPDPQFPGHQGAVMAIWKACVEWGSELHGSGGGDPTQPGGLGSGGANFDPAFAGEADGPGTTNDNIHSLINTTDTGVFAYCEGPASDGWRIRYHENWNWSDGPGSTIFNQRDIQGIACHEYGHALGLDHSASPSATMKPGTSTGMEQRTIAVDDINGVQAIYGTKSASKPRITSVGVAGSTVTIVGTNFSATNNEVWFTNQLVTAAGSTSPLVKATGVSSTGGGTVISISIPELAGQGDVLVKNSGSGHSALSNAFPFDGMGAGPTGPTVASISPSTIDAVNVGTDKFITITGANFTPDVALKIDGVGVFGIPSPYTVVDANTITLDPPLPTSLGAKTLSVENAFGSGSGQLTYQANSTPALQAGSGDEPITFINSVGVTLGGTPGALFFLAFSVDAIPSVLPGIVSLDIGNNFTTLFQIGGGVPIGAAGYTEIVISGTVLPPLTTFHLQGITVEPVPAFPLPSSNPQELTFLF